jgi:hypothetical protein
VDGRQGREVTLARVLEPFPLAWGQQDPHFRTYSITTRRMISGLL